jgi:hypothetical protein
MSCIWNANLSYVRVLVNIKMDIAEIREVGRDWIVLARDRDEWRALMHAVMNLRIP